jgi:hypothetical protein
VSRDAKRIGRYSLADPCAEGMTAPCPNPLQPSPVLSAVQGTNAELFARAAALWIGEGDVIADVTAGNRVFWRNVPDGVRRRVLFTDMAEAPGVDCRSLPYRDASVDVVVLDPPYQPLHGGKWDDGVRETYRLSIDTMQEVMDLYEAAVGEAARVLRAGGRLMVKCQDMSFNHRLHLLHIDVLRSMTRAGIGLADFLVLVNESRMGNPRSARQERARRAHSYLIVGSKPWALR